MSCWLQISCRIFRRFDPCNRGLRLPVRGPSPDRPRTRGGGFDQPARQTIEGRLLIRAAVFGIGWGLVGFARDRRLPRSPSRDGKRCCSCSRWLPAHGSFVRTPEERAVGCLSGRKFSAEGDDPARGDPAAHVVCGWSCADARSGAISEPSRIRTAEAGRERRTVQRDLQRAANLLCVAAEHREASGHREST
jgi:hypothetical protein